MTTGRNDPCPCGSGKKYKRCCGNAQQRQTAPPPAGKFRFDPGSYGGPGAGYTPSILCQKQVSETDWRDHFVLANPQSRHADEASAVAVAEADLAEAFAAKKNGGTEADLAMSLRSKGYVRVTGFRVIREEGDAEHEGAGYRR